ncbi:MAG TPA: hypothetical protein VM869_22765 [Enhygromyxa sp.]|nr:hypothetical protein [Enhygromyxa sp.]
MTLLMLGCLVTAAPACKTSKKKEAAELQEGVEFPEPTAGQVEELGKWVAAAYAGSPGEAPEFLKEGSGSAYVALRAGGKLLGEAWGADGSMADSLADAINKAKDLAGSTTADMVEINLAHSFDSVKDPREEELYRKASGKRVGIRGIELTYNDHYERTPPTTMIANAEKFGAVVKRFLKKAGVKDLDQFAKDGGKARVFESHQVLVRLPSGEGIKLLRGNVLVQPSEVTKANLQATTDLMIEWMLTHLHDDGRLTYLWMPEKSAEKPNDNNMIRQWMGTNALIKVAEKRNDPELWARIAKNIDYNLEHFYEQEGELGLIKHQGSVKLGSLSLAAMAIINHPERARWQAQEHGLRRTIAQLWHEDGAFDCYYPARGAADRNGNVQNFYPGETLLFWAQLYRESRDPELLRRFVKSFRYYKAWHLDPDPKRRRPSFVPWHTQADFILWEVLRSGDAATPTPGESGGEGTQQAEPETPPAATVTPEGWPVGTTPTEPTEIKPEELEQFVFDMNDWLIANMEVWEESQFDDEKGRFHSREKDYGVPHASATGVYIEGLIDAYEMAKRLGDKTRQARYALALSRGIRSVMQLQFVDDVDMYYVTDRRQTKGGLRTDTIRPEVRVDNVQHVLMGVLKVLDRFEPGEYKTD